jgi:(R,R)-butanediol dehydrogenase/meso-butanediol dehydrogenase/diacetyl reductase
MKGVVFTGSKTLELREFPDPTPGDDEVVLKIKASGMCGTDLHVYRPETLAHPDMIAGHEPCGVVVARGSAVSEVQAPMGARVMVHHYDGCRRCNPCVEGWTQLCEQGSTVYGRSGHGAHAQYMKVPARTLVPLPEALTFAEGAAISCGTGTAFGAIKRMKMEAGAKVAVFGQGPVGLSVTMLASAMGAEIIAIDMAASRIETARKFGAATTIDASKTDAVDEIKSLTGGRGVDYAIDCSGAPEALDAAARSTRTWGTMCCVGIGKRASFDINRDVIHKQLTILGSWTFSIAGQADCARFVAEKKLPVRDLFTHSFAINDAQSAYELFDTQTTGKGVILPN